MNITQSDRNALRASQHKLNSHHIGNIIEHKTQDPKMYKQSSSRSNEQQLQSGDQALTPAYYEGKYWHHERKEDLDKDSPPEIEDLKANSWLNMDQIEFDKLEWMSSKADKMYQEKLETTTQFDREGRAVSITTKREDETHDIQSLFKLLESAYDPQVTYSLNVITRIASFASMGYYDGAFDDNIHEILLRGCLLRVRHHMDSPNETICLSALKCMRALLCNTQVDEVILDRIYPLISSNKDSNLWLHTIEMDSQDFTIEMKDSECVEVDTILGLICRTEILERFSYLLKNKTGTIGFAYYECILDILIRVARYSSSACFMLSRMDSIPYILKTFLPTNYQGSMIERKRARQLAIKTLKLMRIIAQAALELNDSNQTQATGAKINLQIFGDLIPQIEVYFHVDCYDLPPEEIDQACKLNLETFRIMKTLCKLEFFQSQMISIIAMSHEKLLKDLRFVGALDAKRNLDSKISVDWQYAAHLLDLIGTIMSRERYCSNTDDATEIYWNSFIKPILFSWITDIIRLKCIPHLDVSITIAAVVHQFNIRADEKSKKDLYYVMIEPIVKESLKSERVDINLFTVLAQAAALRSKILNFVEESGRLRDPKGLPSYGCLNYNLSAQYNFKLSPLFENDSPFILLNTFIHQMPKGIGENEQNIVRIFLNRPNIGRYIKAVTGYYKYSTNYESMVQQSLIAQYEIQMICNLLLLLSRYYLDFDVAKGAIEGQDDENVPELVDNRVECYSDLCFYAISAIGLINMNANHLIELKDRLFDKILLNMKYHKRIATELFEKCAPIRGRDSALFSMDYITGQHNFHQLGSDGLNLLLPVYMSCAQPDRYWIFEPILGYYFDRIKKPVNIDGKVNKVENGVKDNKWFSANVPWRMYTGVLASADDGNIVKSILDFNAIMIQYSSSYLHLVIKPSLEEYLCIIGIIFLDDNLFLHEEVNNALTRNIRTILNQCIQESDKITAPFKDASKIIQPLDLPLADFFNKLVDQYEAVSYGDIAFTNFLLLFIAPESDIMFRKKLFQEKSETCLSLLRIGPESVWAPRQLFTSTKEKDPEMKELLKRSRPFIVKNSFLNYYRAFHLTG